MTTSVASRLTEAFLAATAAESAAGLSPDQAQRPLFPWEHATDFADVAGAQDDGYRQSASALDKVREVILDAMTAAIAGEEDPNELIRKLRRFGAYQPRNVRDAIDAAIRDLSDIAATTYRRAGDGVVRDARRQDVDVPEQVDTDAARGQFDGQVADAPTSVWSRLTAAAMIAGTAGGLAGAVLNVGDAAVAGATTVGKAAVRAAREAKMDGPYDLSRQTVNTAHGQGRSKAVKQLPKPKHIYASELLDTRTCKPCQQVDGRSYATIEEAEADYPHGGYRRCSGGGRCRGTVVYVWDEAEPTDKGLLPLVPVKPDSDRRVRYLKTLAKGALAAAAAIGIGSAAGGVIGAGILRRTLGMVAGPGGPQLSPLTPSEVLPDMVPYEFFAYNLTRLHTHGTLLDDDDYQRTVAENWTAAFTPYLPDDYTLHAIAEADVYSLATTVRWSIKHQGTTIGSMERTLSLDPVSGVLTAHHDYFRIAKDHQKKGLGSAINAAADRWYVVNGIKQTKLNANIDVGGYTWAAAGYDWDLQEEDAGTFIDRAVNLMQRQPSWDPHLQAELDAIEDVRALGKLISPLELARFGWYPTATTWPGKEYMLGTSWFGRRDVPSRADAEQRLADYYSAKLRIAAEAKREALRLRVEAERAAQLAKLPLYTPMDRSVHVLNVWSESALVDQVMPPGLDATIGSGGLAWPGEWRVENLANDLWLPSDSPRRLQADDALTGVVEGAINNALTRHGQGYTIKAQDWSGDPDRTDMLTAGEWMHIFEINDANGVGVGTLVRRVRSDPTDGTLTAFHDEFDLLADHQGKGIATDVNLVLDQFYADNGIGKIKLLANVDVGGYTWARAGYDLDWTTDPAKAKIKALQLAQRVLTEDENAWRVKVNLRMNVNEQMALANSMGVPVAELDQHNPLRRSAEAKDIFLRLNRDEPVAMLELARLGYDPFAHEADPENYTWPGKVALLRSAWHGVRDVPTRMDTDVRIVQRAYNASPQAKAATADAWATRLEEMLRVATADADAAELANNRLLTPESAEAARLARIHRIAILQSAREARQQATLLTLEVRRTTAPPDRAWFLPESQTPMAPLAPGEPPYDTQETLAYWDAHVRPQSAHLRDLAKSLDDDAFRDAMDGQRPYEPSMALSALAHYTSDGAEEVNHALRRGGRSSYEAGTTVDGMEDLFAAARADPRLQTPAPLTVLRGVRTEPDFDPGVDWDVGYLVTENGYLSTTADESTAQQFASGGTLPAPRYWILEIDVPQGTAYLPGIEREQELIFDRGAVMEVVSMDFIHRTIRLRMDDGHPVP